MENKQTKLTISLTNSKLGAQIPSVSTLPACSCRPDAPCRFGCYARKGKYGIGNVQASLRKNYDIYMQNPRSFFEQIVRFLTGGLVTYKYFRWHSAGDIVDAAEMVKGLRGDWKRSSMYYGEKSLSVHCCESALEAALWAANELGIEAPAY